AITNVVSHLQIHQSGYVAEGEVENYIAKADSLGDRIQQMSAVEAVSTRTLVSGMLSSSRSAQGIIVKAVEPEMEDRTTALREKVVEGDYFDGKWRNELLMSTEVAEKLGVDPGSKVVITFQDLTGNITAGAFRIRGLFSTGNDPFDKSHVFALRSDINRLLGAAENGLAHEIAILLDDNSGVEGIADSLKEMMPGLEVRTYREISPELELYESQIEYVSYIYLGIILLALIFGIVNTMLMAVLERVRELGMLMAIGMNRVRVFFMVFLETVILSLLGVPLGLFLSYLTIIFFRERGIDLSAFSETLQMYGLSEVIYFDLDPATYWQVPVMVALTAIIASVYPALKAVNLKPVEAIRKL
ncbi:MAG: FtsX-like permease family protein, partial [Saprospiraceae bacterium]|nr:FtsX-like permease family protein [Saprospiraceae bacterium]